MIAEALRRLLTGPARDTIAALIMEPILCNTSVIPPSQASSSWPGR